MIYCGPGVDGSVARCKRLEAQSQWCGFGLWGNQGGGGPEHAAGPESQIMGQEPWAGEPRRTRPSPAKHSRAMLSQATPVRPS